jgi:hypothetical protein
MGTSAVPLTTYFLGAPVFEMMRIIRKRYDSSSSNWAGPYLECRAELSSFPFRDVKYRAVREV